jgi:hypothetical protein
MLDKNGKPLVGGYVMLNMHGTTGVPALSYSDWNGTLNARQILLDNLGRASAIVENDKQYDLYVYNRWNVLQYSALGVNCEGEAGAGILHFTSSDGSVIIERSGSTIDFRVNKDRSTYGSAEADSVGANGLIEFDTVGSGDITVVSAGTLRIERGKLYHVTVALEFATTTVNPLYCDCQLQDSENTTHKFTLDASRTKQMIELSWDAVSTSDTFQLLIQAPSIFAVTSAELYIHSVIPVVGSTPQLQSDWNVTDTDSPAYIKNKPDLSVYARLADLAQVAFSGDYDDLANKPDLSVFARSADLATVATTGSYNDLTNVPAHLVQDADYVHTDNNFTDDERTKLNSIEAGAEANVQANWSQSDSSADDYIKNKPVIANVPSVNSGDDGKVLMASYSGGIGSYSWQVAPTGVPDSTAADSGKILTVLPDGTPSWEEPAAQPQVQSDWEESDTTDPSYIQNKPVEMPFEAGSNISFSVQNNKLRVDCTAQVIPSSTAQDEGKVLTVDDAGNPKWDDSPTFTQQQSDWNQSNSSAVDYIKNKPSIPVIGTVEL